MSIAKAAGHMLILLTVLLLNSLSFGHTSAMSTMSHGTGASSHETDTSAKCATLCRTAVIERETIIILENENKDDDEPVASFYLQKQARYSSDTLIGQKLYADSVKPPPKIPIYIWHQVFRD
jgi:hypothetical protein